MFEGDDSILLTWPKSVQTERDDVVAFWERAGFNMKLVHADEKGVAEFCGWHFACDRFGLTGSRCPEIKRAIVSASISCAAGARESVMQKRGPEARVAIMDVTAATALSRADAFAGLNPFLSRKYLEYYHPTAIHYRINSPNPHT
eukprot:5348732-Amphidinium_carterae.1